MEGKRLPYMVGAAPFDYNAHASKSAIELKNWVSTWIRAIRQGQQDQ